MGKIALLTESEIKDLIRESVSQALRATPGRAHDSAWDVPKCAEQIGISESKLRAMISEKSIPHFRIGKRILFHPEKVMDWAASNTDSTMDDGFRQGLEAVRKSQRRRRG